MELLLSIIVLLIFIMLMMPIGNIIGGLFYWSENEKRKYEESETD